MDKTGIIKAIAASIEAAPCVDALFLSGSYGNGLQDRFSDIDFLAVTADREAFAPLWRAALPGEIVLFRDRGPLIMAITGDWVRIDVYIAPPDKLAGRAQDGLKPLFDRTGIYRTLPVTTVRKGPDTARVAAIIEEFLRILGLLPVAMGRGEYLNGPTGVFHLRNLFIDLLIAENDAPYRGGALHLNRLISDEQKAALASLPATEANRESIIAAHLDYATAFLPRARRLSAYLAIEWPDAFEAATWRYLKRELDLDPPKAATEQCSTT